MVKIFYQCAGVASLYKCQLISTSDDIHDMIYTCVQNNLPQTPHHSVAIPRTLNPKMYRFQLSHFEIGPHLRHWFSCLKIPHHFHCANTKSGLTKFRPSSKIRTHLQLFYKYGHVHSAKWFGWSLGTDRCPLFPTLLVEGGFNIAQWN